MDNKKKLEKELRFLTSAAIQEELENNKAALESEDVNIKSLADNIYTKRGIDITKLNRNITSNLINDLSNAFTGFKNKDKVTKRKMIIDIVYLILLIILVKIPFDLVRDIGYEYIEMLSTNNLYYTIWNLALLLLYTITAVCTLVVLLRNFNNKYVK